jgi:hypothetical protein
MSEKRPRYHDLVDDESVVSWQLGRPARRFRRVAARCAYGYPAVTEQAPFDDDGAPFPTTYYLTCPWLVAEIARVEGEGGVERYSRAAAQDPDLARSLAAADAEQRRLRPELPLGIAGTRTRENLKCLHAHAAFALARPGYRLGEEILSEVDERWCPDARCGAALAGKNDR